MSKSITEYFRPVGAKKNDCNSSLPPKILHSALREVRKAEEKIEETGSKRGNYAFYTGENKAKVAKFAAENGVTKAMRHFKETKEFPDLKEPTVRGWVNKFKDIMASLGPSSSMADVTTLEERKRGRPLLVGEDVESYVRQFLRELRNHGGAVNTTITLAAATGIILAKDASLLAQNRGELDLSKEWAQRMMRRMGFVKRKASTGVKVAPEVFKELQKQYLSDIRSVVVMEDIPPDLIINWDQTVVKYVPGPKS